MGKLIQLSMLNESCPACSEPAKRVARAGRDVKFNYYVCTICLWTGQKPNPLNLTD